MADLEGGCGLQLREQPAQTQLSMLSHCCSLEYLPHLFGAAAAGSVLHNQQANAAVICLQLSCLTHCHTRQPAVSSSDIGALACPVPRLVALEACPWPAATPSSSCPAAAAITFISEAIADSGGGSHIGAIPGKVTRLLALVTDTTTATATATTTEVVVASITATHPGSQPCDGQAKKLKCNSNSSKETSRNLTPHASILFS